MSTTPRGIGPRGNLTGAAWRLAVFVVVCLLGAAAMVIVFGQLRFQKELTYKAEFTTVTGLQGGNFVRIAGVEVGKVKKIWLKPDTTAVVEFSADPSVALSQGTRALIRYDNLIGGRYLELAEGAGSVRPLRPGQTIPTERTQPALDLDALIGGFRPLFRALDPEQVNALSGQLIQALQGQGDTISSFLAETASVTGTLADRDELIGQVINNLNTVLGSVGDQSENLGNAIGSLSEIVKGLSARKGAITSGLAHASNAAATVADLLTTARPPVTELLTQSDRVDTLILKDRDYVDSVLNTLPDSYQLLSRLGLYGDFFSFYLCDLILKINGKGGQPVYIKLAGQDTGRCEPK